MRHFLETVRQGLTEGKAQDIAILHGNAIKSTAKVWVNPTHNDLMVLVGRFGEVRGCNSVEDGTTYIWDANVGIHFTMKRAIWRNGLTSNTEWYDVNAMPMWADFYVAHITRDTHDWESNFNIPIGPDVMLFMNSESALEKTSNIPSFKRMLGS